MGGGVPWLSIAAFTTLVSSVPTRVQDRGSSCLRLDVKKAVSGLMGVPEGLTSEESSLISAWRTIWTPHQSSPTHFQVTSIAELHHPVEELAGCCRYFSRNLVLIVLEKSLYLVLTGVTQASLWWAVPECAVVLPQPLEDEHTLLSFPSTPMPQDSTDTNQGSFSDIYLELRDGATA